MQVETIANNQVIVITSEGKFFFSYDTLIAVRDYAGILYLTSCWDSSATTLKYLKRAFNLEHLTKKQIQQKLDNGEFSNYSEWEIQNED